MIEKNKISVAISTYNRAGYLKEALSSIKCQTVAPFEILVQNDGGSDNTEEVVRGSGLDVRYFYWENHGLAACRNQLILQASGDWILFFDDDDVLFPKALETFQKYLEDPEARILYGRYQRIDSEGKFLPTVDKYDILPQGMAAEALFRKNFLLPSCTLLPLNLIREHKLQFPIGQAAEDYYFFLRLALLVKVQGIDARLVCRRRHRKNVSSLAGAKGVMDQIRTLEDFLKFSGDLIPLPIRKKRMSEMYARYAKSLSPEEREKSREAWETSLRLHFSFRHYLQMLFS